MSSTDSATSLPGHSTTKSPSSIAKCSARGAPAQRMRTLSRPSTRTSFEPASPFSTVTLSQPDGSDAGSTQCVALHAPASAGRTSHDGCSDQRTVTGASSCPPWKPTGTAAPGAGGVCKITCTGSDAHGSPP